MIFLGAAEISSQSFIEAFFAASEEFEKNALAKGFWEGEPSKGEKIALMHSELSELLEAERRPDVEMGPRSKKIPDFTESEDELADLMIRAMDYAHHHKMRLAEAIIAKHQYNTTRPYKHGKKF